MARAVFDWRDLGRKATEIVTKLMAEKAMTNTEKRREAERQLAAEIDKAVSFGEGALARVLEAFDGQIIKLIVTIAVESAYSAVKAAAAKPAAVA